MKRPIRPQSGQRIPKNWFRDLYDYIMAATTIRGDKKNIAVTMTDAGQVIRYIGKNTNALSAGKGSGSSSDFQYDGPFALRIEGSGESRSIRCREGLIWTPTTCGRCNPTYISPLPSSSKLIVISSSGTLSSIDEDPLVDTGLPVVQDPNYWNTNAVLGRYDAETESVTQYHFSPIIFLIPTEDFIITP
jgi:hypothetical protein